MEYLLILSLFLLAAVWMEWRFRVRLYESRKEAGIIVLVFFVIGVLWDTFAIWRGHWAFPGNGMVGIRIGLMPLEEYLFVLVVPYWIITLYRVLTKHIKG